jgi:NADPH:quinone reductase-like Zn-dependent oxidoreductase
MKAIAYTQSGLPIDDPKSLVDLELPDPTPGSRDLLVAVKAVSVNPVDTKVRRNTAVTVPRVLGWDAAGGRERRRLRRHDLQAGRRGILRRLDRSTRQQQRAPLVDERIVGHKPASLGFGEAAALPLTSITAWELLFDRLGVPEDGGQDSTLLIVGAGGGVGSILTQLARKLTRLTVVGTAS